MPTLSTFDPGKAIVQDTAIQIPLDDLFHIGPKKSVLL